MGPEFPENPTLEKILYELRLIRWHMELQVRQNKQEEKWREYMRTVDKHGKAWEYLESLAHS